MSNIILSVLDIYLNNEIIELIELSNIQRSALYTISTKEINEIARNIYARISSIFCIYRAFPQIVPSYSVLGNILTITENFHTIRSVSLCSDIYVRRVDYTEQERTSQTKLIKVFIRILDDRIYKCISNSL